MKKLLSFILILTSLSFIARGQNSTPNICGKVVDNSNIPIVGVAVILFGHDSTHISSTLTDIDGNFNFKAVIPPFKLIFQHLSYEQYTLNTDATVLGTITLNDNITDIDAVVVKGERPIVKIEDGKLAYNLQAVAKNKAVNNAYEALAKLPGVREKDGVLELTGAGAVNVIINGKPTTMTSQQVATLLKSTPVDRVEKAEVMYSTPPKYNVRGASINLVLRRNYEYSFTGEIHGNFSNQHVNSWDVGGNIVFSSPKWSGDVTYSGGQLQNIKQVELFSKHTLGGTTYDINQNQELMASVQQHNIRAAIEYAPEGKSSFSAVYTGEFHPAIDRMTTADGTFVKSNNKGNGNDGMHNIALRYTHPKGLNVGVDYTHYNNSSFSNMKNIYTNGDTTIFNVNSSQKIDKLHTYIDANNAFNNGWSLSYGASFDWSKDKDLQQYTVEQGDIATVNTDATLTEYVGNVYAGFSKQLPKGNLSISLAGEYYQREDYKQWTLYPQASFMWQFDQNNHIQLSFSSNKIYPSFWDMQQSITYLDGYSEIHGNIWLKPALNYSAQFVYMLKQKYIFVLFWNEKPNYFTQTAYQSPDRLALIYQSLNWDFNRQFGFNVSIPFKIGKWLDSRATFTGLNMRQKCSSFYDISFDRSKLVGVVQLENSIKLAQKPNITLDISGYYQTAAIQGTYDIDPSWGVDAGIKWQFAKDRATISAKCTDIFNTTVPFTKVRFGSQNLDMVSGAYSRMFTIHFSYRFGGYKEKNRDKVDNSRFGH